MFVSRPPNNALPNPLSRERKHYHYPSGHLWIEVHFDPDGLRHKEDGPDWAEWYENWNVLTECYYLKGFVHQGGRSSGNIILLEG
jgi:hypothetical protein